MGRVVDGRAGMQRWQQVCASVCPVRPLQQLGMLLPCPCSRHSHDSRCPLPVRLLCCAVGPAAQAPSSSGGLMGMLLGGSMMSGGGYRGQEPVLSANYAFDMAFPFAL